MTDTAAAVLYDLAGRPPQDRVPDAADGIG